MTASAVVLNLDTHFVLNGCSARHRNGREVRIVLFERILDEVPEDQLDQLMIADIPDIADTPW